jgi:hypothetical protein
MELLYLFYPGVFVAISLNSASTVGNAENVIFGNRLLWSIRINS